MKKLHLIVLALSLICITAQAQSTATKKTEVEGFERIKQKDAQVSGKSLKATNDIKQLEKAIAKEQEAIVQMKAMFEKNKETLSAENKGKFKKSIAQAEQKLTADKEKLRNLRNKH